MENCNSSSVIYVASLYTRTGYGTISRAYVTALNQAGLRVRVCPTGWRDPGLPPGDLQLLRDLESTPDYERVVAIFHAPPTWEQARVHIPNLALRVNVSLFETDRIPADWLGPLNEFDQVWVPTEFHRGVYVESGVRPELLRVIPFAHPWLSTPRVPLKVPLAGNFRFLNISEFTPRKRLDTLLEAYFREFDAGEEVNLYLKLTYPRWKDDNLTQRSRNDFLEIMRSLERRYPNRPPLIIDEELGTPDDLRQLLLSSDAYVSTDSIGYTLPALEAMACGLPILTSSWCGGSELVPPGYSLLIPSSVVTYPVPQALEEYSPLYRGHKWAEITIDDVQRLLRSVFDMAPQARFDLGQALRKFAEQRFGMAPVAHAIQSALSQIPKDTRCESKDYIEKTSKRHFSTNMDRPDVSARSDVASSNDENGISWAANFFSFSGYSHMSRQIVRALADKEAPLRIVPIEQETHPYLDHLERRSPEHHMWTSLINRQLRKKGTFIFFHPPVSWQGVDFFAEVRRKIPDFNRYVGITMFETDRLPAGWAEACNGMDEVWVPSTFNKETFASAGVDPSKLKVMPFGIDTTIYDPSRVRPIDIKGKRGFTFLSTFQWNKRKGWDVLLRAYLSAFSSEDEVCLVLRTYPDRIKTPSIRERIDAFTRELGFDPAKAPSIILIDEFLPEAKMPALYAAADAFVLPTRGEGWGIPFMEAMASGLPTIGTRWSSHLDFMNDENSFLIDIDGLTPVDSDQTRENPFYTPDQLWAEPSVEHAAKLMRFVYEHQGDARQIGNKAREYIESNWTLERTADWILQRTSSLMSRSKSTPFPSPSNTNQKPKKTDLDIVWHGPVYDPSGYADEVRHLILNLRAQNIQVAARPIGRHSENFLHQLNSAIRQTVDSAIAKQVTPGFVSVIHFPAYVFKRVPGAVYHIGRTMFETDSLPPDWVDRCNQMDEIWVPTEFNLETFRKAGVCSRLMKVPGGIDTDRFRPGLEPLELSQINGKCFLSIFEWSYRKGWDILLRAWAKAFTPEDDVTLLLRAYPINATDTSNTAAVINERIDRYLRENLRTNRNRLAPIVVLGEQLSDADMPRLYASAYAYVAPSRGEGWGRPQMEAMSCGLPVIATRWSGNLEFMTDDNSLLIDVDRLATIDERAENPIYRGQRWAEPSVTHLVSLLKRVAAEPEAMRSLGEQARSDMEARWSWDKAAKIVSDRLSEIQSEIANNQVIISRKPLAIKWEGAQFAHHSLALVNRELCLSLTTLGHDVSICPTEPSQFRKEDNSRFHALERRINAKLSRSPDVHVRHGWPPNFNPPGEGRWVMVQPWEFGSIPKIWIKRMKNAVDEVWVPTQFVRRCYIDSGMPADQVQVVPNGVNTESFKPDAIPMSLATRKKYRFLFVGGTIGRKGPDILLNAYLATFTREDDVCLVIKDMGGNSFYKGQTLGDEIRAIQAKDEAPEILYITDELGPQELPGLYRACDCLVHPYRGEGFGLPIAEAMACGLPVIVTGAGACLDFCNDQVAYLIPAEKRYLPENRIGEWETVGTPYLYEPSMEATARLMREVFENREAAKEKGARAARWIDERFTWAKAAEVAEQRLRSLSSRPIRRYSSRSTAVVQSRWRVSCVILENGSPGNQMWSSLVANTRHQLDLLLCGCTETPSAKLPEGWTLDSSNSSPAQEINRLIQADGSDAVLLLSPDVIVPEGWMDRLLVVLEKDSSVALVGPVSRQAPKPQRVTAKYKSIGKEFRRHADQVARRHSEDFSEVDYLGGFCILFSKRSCRQVGALREDVPFADALWEYFARVRMSGLRIIVAQDAYVHHEKLDETEGAAFDRLAMELSGMQQALDQALEAGQAAIDRGDLESAAQAFYRAVEQYPEISATHAALASTLLALGRFNDAIPALRKASELAPTEANVHNQLGVALYQAGDPDGSEDAFKKARELDDADPQPLLNLIDLYRTQERYDEATEVVKDAIRIDPNNPEVLVAFSTLSIELGDAEAAKIAVNRLQEIHPTNESIGSLMEALAAV